MCRRKEVLIVAGEKASREGARVKMRASEKDMAQDEDLKNSNAEKAGNY